MAFLKNIFSKSSSSEKEVKKTNINWIPLTSLEQLSILKEQSKTETILIFKHSTRCGISKMVIKQFEKLFTEDYKDLKVYYLDLLNYRELSNEVGYQFQVAHQSPQLLVIKGSVAVVHASHYEIIQINLQNF